jgi:hypothetical protein
LDYELNYIGYNELDIMANPVSNGFKDNKEFQEYLRLM